jgi:hypothetical protein
MPAWGLDGAVTKLDTLAVDCDGAFRAGAVARADASSEARSGSHPRLTDSEHVHLSGVLLYQLSGALTTAHGRRYARVLDPLTAPGPAVLEILSDPAQYAGQSRPVVGAEACGGSHRDPMAP